jgi:hypothetical protein
MDATNNESHSIPPRISISALDNMDHHRLAIIICPNGPVIKVIDYPLTLAPISSRAGATYN